MPTRSGRAPNGDEGGPGVGPGTHERNPAATLEGGFHRGLATSAYIRRDPTSITYAGGRVLGEFGATRTSENPLGAKFAEQPFHALE